jgi:hypothetical protein
MAALTRSAVLAVFGTGSAVVFGFASRDAGNGATPGVRLADHDGCMGGPADMRRYAEMFHRHSEITRTVEDVPGGVRTTTQSNSPDLAAQLQAHVSSMYSHLDQGAEIMCMSDSLPMLFRQANGYRRRMTFTPTGVIAEETSDDPALVEVIRAHAREVTGFVRDGMPSAMRGMMGCRMMGPGVMGPRGSR